MRQWRFPLLGGDARPVKGEVTPESGRAARLTLVLVVLVIVVLVTVVLVIAVLVLVRGVSVGVGVDGGVGDGVGVDIGVGIYIVGVVVVHVHIIVGIASFFCLGGKGVGRGVWQPMVRTRRWCVIVWEEEIKQTTAHILERHR